jgi:hypothetical protein
MPVSIPAIAIVNYWRVYQHHFIHQPIHCAIPVYIYICIYIYIINILSISGYIPTRRITFFYSYIYIHVNTYHPYTSRAPASRVTGVSKGGKPMKKRGGLQERSLTGWGSRPLTASSLGTLSLWNFVLLASLFDDATFSWFGLPLTSLYYKTCTVLLRTTKLAQSISLYYFVLQSLHKIFPGTTSYYKACTRYFPVLSRTSQYCTVRLAQNYAL